MCRSCYGDHHDLFEDLYRRRDPFFGGGFGFGGDVNREYFAPVSQRAKNALEDAKKIFLQHLATVDTSNGPVTTEIIKFHLVPDMRKKFNKFVKEYGCTGTSRQITRAEQDLINKTRKSLLHFTSVNVTRQAQDAFLAANPNLPKSTTTPIPATSGSGTSVSSASTSSSQISASASSSSSSGVVRDLTNKKTKQKLNQAAVTYAALSASIKQRNSLKKA
ncbi:hypothetical protein BDZ97DRAFT_1920201 [Flammula alnicola]|nr:hypothetical protein BDZ97DRAFT_1920201 [Flammula alnicola]